MPFHQLYLVSHSKYVYWLLKLACPITGNPWNVDNLIVFTINTLLQVLYTKGVPPGSVSDDVQQAFVNQFSASSFSTHTTREVGTDLRDEIISVAEDSLKVGSSTMKVAYICD